MNESEVKALLAQVSAGELGVDAAFQRLQFAPLADLGYAQVDLNRRERCGFPEVIFCEGKTPEWIEGVVGKLGEAGQDCLATRVSSEQAQHLASRFPRGRQDRIARTFWLPSDPDAARSKIGRVFVLTAGTSDLPVAREAVVTAEALGCEVDLVADVGVAGIHRLLRHQER
ncbi:MAG TPA: 1-(5-phosphoribosyl)-5-amino-4-imidazole-carboxylate carboxylase, partial [Gemmataceae bacterium]